MRELRSVVAALLALSILPAAFVCFAAWSDSARDTSGDAVLTALIALAWVIAALGTVWLIVPKRNRMTENDNA